jgi:hypothetical protein
LILHHIRRPEPYNRRQSRSPADRVDYDAMRFNPDDRAHIEERHNELMCVKWGFMAGFAGSQFCVRAVLS